MRLRIRIGLIVGVIVGVITSLGSAAVPSVTAGEPDTPSSNASSNESGSDKLPVPSDPAPLDGKDGRELSVRVYDPISQLKVKETELTQAAVPVVDVHTHFFYRMRHNKEALDDFVETMDRNRIAVCVSLDGKLGSQLDEHIAYLWSQYKDRFVIYTNVDWQGDGVAGDPSTWACHRQGFAERTAEEIRAAVARGVSGLKLFKRFGLGYKNPDGSLVEIDDPRWDPIWAVCGELGIPIIIHTGDPAAFFEPIDAKNERWEELSRHPNWSFYGDQYPSRGELFAARNRVIARHPQTTFIGAHMANNPEDLATLSEWLDTYPNLVIEPSSRIGELGRQPFTARQFLIKYANRIMFGTDGPQPEKRLRYYWRFLETDDEYFPYSEKSPPPQGFWNIYGVNLPEDVLEKIYHGNASRIIPGVRERVAKFKSE